MGNMRLFLIFNGFLSFANGERTVDEKVAHMKKVGSPMLKEFFGEKRDYKQLWRKLSIIHGIVEDSVDDCYVEPLVRGSPVERYQHGNFKAANNQIHKQILRIRNEFNQDTKPCKKAARKIERKVKNSFMGARNKFCELNSDTNPWCDREYEYNLPALVAAQPA